MNRQELLEHLTNIDAVSGREKEICDWITSKINISHKTDRFGNLFIGELNKKAMTVGIYGHMDEVGFLVKHITDDGFIYFHPLGSWWGHVVLGQEVRITARKNNHKIKGIIGTLPEQSKMSKEVLPIEKMYIDIGASSKGVVEKWGIQIGDMICPATQAQHMGHSGFLMAKALDDRIGCATVISVMEEMKEQLKNIHPVGILTVQEEVGTRGSQVVHRTIEPDINIVIDVANAKDTPKAASYKNRVAGEGPCVVVYDKTSLAPIGLVDLIVDIAKESNISVQYDYLSGGGTDAGSLQDQTGAPTIVISVPVRYCHSFHSMVHISDYENTIELLKKILKKLDQR